MVSLNCRTSVAHHDLMARKSGHTAAHGKIFSLKRKFPMIYDQK